jgi:hypothetical protein
MASIIILLTSAGTKMDNITETCYLERYCKRKITKFNIKIKSKIKRNLFLLPAQSLFFWYPLNLKEEGGCIRL